MANPTWNFPPRGGGIEFVNDSARAHFSDDPIPKLVRELIQNSLDAKQDGLASPVHVAFCETSVKRNLIDGATLRRHLQSCLDRARAADRGDMAEVYADALSVAKQPNTPCLKVQDTGTVGLNDARWKALVVQEGAVSKGGGAPGGSYGIGKNAILNVSDLQAVFYSTRLVEGRKGRIEKLQGKATLTGHLAPNGTGDDLQHVGFYSQRNGSLLMGKDIHEFFRLDDTGTGVFIMGFNPHSTDWVDQVATAVIENIFHAIHHKKLTVEVSARGEDPIQISHETIDDHFKRLQPLNRIAVHYYRAIRDLGVDDVELTRKFRRLGHLRLYIDFDSDAPRRFAHINRNGMLITDSREQRVNPLAPRGRGLWPDFVDVVVPDTDAGDPWLRRMENPSHDSLSSGQLRDEKDRREANGRLRQARREIGEVIERKAKIDRYGEASNLDELADILPDTGDDVGDRTLTTRVVESRTERSNVVEIGEVVEVEGGGPRGNPAAAGGADSPHEGGQGDDGHQPVRWSDRWAVLREVRYIPLSSSEAICGTPCGGCGR